MKKIALVFGLAILMAACHTKKPQDQSGINDPVNISSGDVDKAVMDKTYADTSAKIVHEVQAKEADSAASCIDSTKIDKVAACTMDYKPVCGCDGKTYSNQCVAEKAGVTKWTEGECAGTKGKEIENAPSKKKKKK